MNRTVERRIRRLERAASNRPDELVECEMSDEAKDALRGAFAAMGVAPAEVEACVNRRYRTACDHVANQNPVEREQRLLAIREMVADNLAVRARLDEALDEARRPAQPRRRSSIRTRAMLEHAQAPAA
jgi:hypothetical protein